MYKVILETGSHLVFAHVPDWPGWVRSGKTAPDALGALLAYAPRYQAVLQATSLDFKPPKDQDQLKVAGQVEGKKAVDFGVTDLILDSDDQPPSPQTVKKWKQIITASWTAFDKAVEKAAGKALRKGPRGGGRDLEKIRSHVFEGGEGYLHSLAGSSVPAAHPGDQSAHLQQREEILAALAAVLAGEIAPRGPRGGVRWKPARFVRRLVWHILDHTWEIADRLEG